MHAFISAGTDPSIHPSPGPHVPNQHPIFLKIKNKKNRELRGKVDYIQQRHEKFGRMLKAPGSTAADPAFKDLYTCAFACCVFDCVHGCLLIRLIPPVDGWMLPSCWSLNQLESTMGPIQPYPIEPVTDNPPEPHQRCTGTWRRRKSSARSWRRWWRSSRTTASASATSTTWVDKYMCLFEGDSGGGHRSEGADLSAACICMHHRRSWRSGARS